MASVQFGLHGTLVTDDTGNNFYGEYKFIGGHVESEIFERSFPGSSGVLEIDSGDRRSMIAMRVTWYTPDPEQVDDKIDEILREKRYQTLSFPDGVGNTRNIDNVRLVAVGGLGSRISGYLNGTKVLVMSKDLIFKKVSFE